MTPTMVTSFVATPPQDSLASKCHRKYGKSKTSLSSTVVAKPSVAMSPKDVIFSANDHRDRPWTRYWKTDAKRRDDTKKTMCTRNDSGHPISSKVENRRRLSRSISTRRRRRTIYGVERSRDASVYEVGKTDADRRDAILCNFDTIGYV